MLFTRTCALAECGQTFQTDNPRKTHCTREHANLNNVRRWRAKHRKPRGGGGGGGNGGVEKEILRAAAVWLIGVQREANEIERALSSIPKGIKRPREGDIPTLKR
jgi:hypothetical protein